MADLFQDSGFTRDDKIGCLRREIAMREKVYPGWVARRKMTQDKADRELEIMQAILKDYEDKPAGVINPCDRCGAEIAPCMDTHCDRCVYIVLSETALKPFADYADSTKAMPAEFIITNGSPLAKRQLQMGDCYRAAEALKWGENNGTRT